MMKKSNILIAMIEGGGNVPAMFGLASRLIKNGHSLTILSEPCLREAVNEMDASFTPFTSHFTRTNRKEDVFNDWNASKFNSPVLERVMFRPAPYVIDRCIEVIRANSIHLLIVDVLIFPAIIAAEYVGIPKIVVCHMPEFLPGPNRPPGNLGLRPGKGLVYRLRDKFLAKLMRSKLDKFKPELNDKLTALSLSPLVHTIDLFDRAELRLIQTLRSFDVPIDPSPNNVRYIGPEMNDPDWVSKEELKFPWPGDTKKKLVVISFSTTFQNQASAIQHSINALSKLDVYGCVTLGPAMEGINFTIPENVLVLKSVAHSLLFSQADLVITHGGHGTIIRALSHGLPIICLPMGRDQDDNALKVVSKGCGIKLPRKSGSTKIKKAIARIFSNDSYKRNARKMKDELGEETGIEEVIEEINHLLIAEKRLTIIK